MSSLQPVEATVEAYRSGVRCTAAGVFRHLCPVKDETDEGTIEIGWDTTGVTLELHWLAGYLERWKDTDTTHEDAVQRIADRLRSYGVANVTVTFRGETAGLMVTATAEVP
jgi:NADPH-dependent 7-cyano-7-deazaguanine reductase QueF